jgi:hypothetical protein
MNSLVKVPPYSKLNFQGKIFFTQNWCNITLNKPPHYAHEELYFKKNFYYKFITIYTPQFK